MVINAHVQIVEVVMGGQKEIYKMKISIKKIGGLLIAILGFVFSWNVAYAYERVLFNQGIGYATSSAGNVNKMTSGATTLNGLYEINCEALGISEIASTTVSLYVDISTRSAFNLMNWETGQLSDNSYTITTTAAPFSYTFTPPIWCDDTTVHLMGYSSISTAVNFGSKGADDVDAVPHAWCYDSSGTGCSSMGNVRGMDIAIIAVGSYSTSSVGSGGGDVSTTTYNFYFSTSTLTATSSSSSGDNSLWISLIALTFLWYGFISVTYKQVFSV